MASLLAGVLALALLLTPARPTPTSTDLLPAANAARAAAGVAPLAVCWPLEVDAMVRAHVVLARDPDGLHEADHAGFAAGILGAGYTTGGENLALLAPATLDAPADRARVAALWLGSPPHRRNLLDPAFRCFGSAELAEPGGGVLYVEEFGG